MNIDNEKLKDLREDYQSEGLTKKSMLDNPFDQFNSWFSNQLQKGSLDANSMVLTTSTLDGKASSRVVLLKEVRDSGLYFYTNYNSRKGKEIEENPNVHLLFVWLSLHQQIRIEGTAAKISREQSEKYFYSRPIESQIGAAVSPQSSEIDERAVLEKSMKDLQNEKVSMPENWGGYRVEPTYFEFWQGQTGRLHDRICYQLENGTWRKFRLAP